MDETTWAALTAALTILGGIWTVLAWRRRGAANGTRALGFTLLPAAAWLTGTLEMFTEIAGSITDWALGLALTPWTWAGVALAGTSGLLLLVSAWLRDRQLARGQSGRGRPQQSATPGAPAAGAPRGEVGAARAPAADSEDEEIEAILRRRGIS